MFVIVIVIDNLPHAIRYRLAKVGTVKTGNSNWSVFPLLSFVIIDPLRCSSLQMFYAANLRHTCLVLTPFKMFPCSDKFAGEKSGCCHSKISKFCHCNRNCKIYIVLNHHNLEPITSKILSKISFLLVEKFRHYRGSFFLTTLYMFT